MKSKIRSAVLFAVLCSVASIFAVPQPPAASLESVLNRMDKAAAEFRSVQADFAWEQFQMVVNETDTQKGTMYLRRTGQNSEMAANILGPDGKTEKYVLFSGGEAQVFQPRINQVTKYSAGKNKGLFESFVVLGFGGRGHDLQKSFDVHFVGNENVGGINAAKLELTPKEERIRNIFKSIILWIDPARGVSVQQKFLEPSGDYRLAKYSDIQMRPKIGNDVFKLKTDSKTKFITPNG